MRSLDRQEEHGGMPAMLLCCSQQSFTVVSCSTRRKCVSYVIGSDCMQRALSRVAPICDSPPACACCRMRVGCGSEASSIGPPCWWSSKLVLKCIKQAVRCIRFASKRREIDSFSEAPCLGGQKSEKSAIHPGFWRCESSTGAIHATKSLDRFMHGHP